MVLEDSFGKIKTLEKPGEIQNILEQYDIQVIILDLNFAIGDSDGAEGLAWISKLKSINPHVSIIILTAHGFLDVAVRALKQGATDFLEKPFSNEKLVATVQAGLNLARSQEALDQAKSSTKVLLDQANRNTEMVIGKSSAMGKLIETVAKVAHTDASILITGEHGTGKEVLTRYIHRQSARAAQPLITADLSAVTKGLFESTLFGHVKGAFTDASENRAGLMETANLGTLLLDEIGDTDHTLQAKLLSALQNREVNRVGEHRPRAIDIRLISTSHRSIEELSDSSFFRQDLLFRINTVHLEIPALRYRKEDIKPLIQHFCKSFNKKYDRSFELDKSQLATLKNYDWPGNVRELKNSIERMVIMNEYQDLSRATAKHTNEDNLYEVEKMKIIEIMERHAGNISRTAAELGIGRNTLYRKMKKYDL